ncbi:MAG: two-component regulator propeller domain-containing protein [Bacteroidota bacterium]
MSPRLFIGVLYLAFLPFLVLGQERYHFQHLDISSGLTDNDVLSITQDSYGYIWLGTARGLHRYSGNDFKYFNYSPEHPNSISPGAVRSVFEDSKGRLWIGTEGGGISVLENGKFKHYDINSGLTNNFVEQIIEYPDGSIYIATWGGGINIFKDSTFEYLGRNSGGKLKLPSDNVVDILYDESTGFLWIATWDNGLCLLNGDSITVYYDDPTGFNSKQARTLAKTDDGSIWIGSWGNGLFRFRDDRFEHINISGNYDNHSEVDKILSLSPHPGGGLWIGTFGRGIKFYDGNTFSHFYNDPNDRNSLSSNYVESTFVDADSNLWVGTFGGGITKFNRSFFEVYKHDPEDPSTISDNFVRCIMERKNGDLWVGNRATGIDIFDGDSFQPISRIYRNSFDKIKTYIFMESSNGDIYLGGVTGTGLYVLSNGNLKEVSATYGIDFSVYHTSAICETYDGSIWIGGVYDLGLIRIKEGSVQQYFHNPNDDGTVSGNNIYNLVQARDSTLWIGTRDSGVTSFKNGKFVQYLSDPNDENTLGNNKVLSIHESNNGNIWVGTEKGLNKIDPDSGKILRYFEQDGLFDEYIASILEDDQGYLWLGTHKGLLRMNPRTNQFWGYDVSDGIGVYPFNVGAAHRGAVSGKLYFGGIGGFISFDPNNIHLSSGKSSPQITDVLISNQSLYQDGTQLITMKRGIDKVTFTYSDMEFDFSQRNQYSYQLVGFDKSWQYAKFKTEAVYTNLPAGNFIFQVRSSGDNLNWSEPISVKLEVIPFWYETSYFLIVMLLLLVISIFLLFKWRTRYISLQAKKLSKRVQEQTKELEDRNSEILESNEKLKELIKENERKQIKIIESEKMASLGVLTAGVAHEMNNPLQFITSGLNLLKKRLNGITQDEGLNHAYELMREGIKRASGIVASLNSYSRDSGSDKEVIDFYELLETNISLLKLQYSNNISLINNCKPNVLLFRGNRSRFHQVILNLLYNAIQAIKDEGEVRIDAQIKSERIELRIHDNGVGISKDNINKIFDPFFTTKEPGEGTGLGLGIVKNIVNNHGGKITIQSEPGKGSVVILDLPLATENDG